SHRADDVHLAVRSDLGFLAALRENPAPLLFVEDSGICLTGFEVSLISADDPFALIQLFAAILNTRIATDDFERESQFEVIDSAVAPDQKSVSLRGVVGSRLAGDRAVFHRPELGIAVPAREILAVEKALEPGLFVGKDRCRRNRGTGRAESKPGESRR